MAKKKAKKGSSKKGTTKAAGVMTVDFSDTESRGGQKSDRGKRYKEGDYLVRTTKVTKGKSPQKKTPFVEYTFKFREGKYKGDTIRDQLYLSENSLWRLRQFIEATGAKVPSKKVKFDPKKYLNKDLAITIADDTWEDDDGNERVKSKVVDHFLASALEEMEDEDVDLEDEDEDTDDEEEDEDTDDEEEDEEEEEDTDDEDSDDENMDEVDLDEL